MVLSLLRLVTRAFDALEARWESQRSLHLLGSLLVAVFLGALALIELNRHGLLGAVLGEPLAHALPLSHFRAVELALTLLLVFEVMGLVFTLARSVSSSVGKQFEILSLILVRQSFKEFGSFAEPVAWAAVREAVPGMLAEAFGALVIFVILGAYERIQRHRPITADSQEQWSFVAIKKLIALMLFAVLGIIGGGDLWRLATGRQVFPFFETFYTVLIFNDVLLVLLSLRYSSTYRVVFRNSGFAVATVFLRLALTAPHALKAALGVVAALFALGLSAAYNANLHAREPTDEPADESE